MEAKGAHRAKRYLSIDRYMPSAKCVNIAANSVASTRSAAALVVLFIRMPRSDNQRQLRPEAPFRARRWGRGPAGRFSRGRCLTAGSPPSD